MTTLPEFLLAQIEADEAVASAALDCEEPTGSASWYVDGPAVNSGKFWVCATGEKFTHEPIAQHIARHDPARVLRECAAKRAIVEAWQSFEAAARSADDLPTKMTAKGAAIGLEIAIKSLASVYADREGFDAGWLA